MSAMDRRVVGWCLLGAHFGMLIGICGLSLIFGLGQGTLPLAAVAMFVGVVAARMIDG